MITIIKPENVGKINPSGSFKVYVVTHDGVFHSDEVFSVALLRLLHNNIDIVRTRDEQVLKIAVENPEVFVLDVGGQYAPAKRNFDHHQREFPRLPNRGPIEAQRLPSVRLMALHFRGYLTAAPLKLDA